MPGIAITGITNAFIFLSSISLPEAQTKYSPMLVSGEWL